MGNEDTLSTEPVLNNTHETDETVSQVCHNLNENMSGLPFSEVKNCKLKNPKNITIDYLNVNSLRNKYIEELIKSKLDVFLVSKTKIDHSFPNQQFSIDGYKTYRRDRNNFGLGLLLYLIENILRRELTAEQIDSSFEIVFIEITLQTGKMVGKKPPNQNEEYF